MESAAADYFADHIGAEVLASISVNVLDLGPFQQIKSSRWPEACIYDTYLEVFPRTIATTMSSVTFITETGTISTISLTDLLRNFNVLDFNVLIEGHYLATEPDGATQLTDNRLNNYLWLLKKTTVADGRLLRSRPSATVVQLLSVTKSEFDSLAKLT